MVYHSVLSSELNIFRSLVKTEWYTIPRGGLSLLYYTSILKLSETRYDATLSGLICAPIPARTITFVDEQWENIKIWTRANCALSLSLDALVRCLDQSDLSICAINILDCILYYIPHTLLYYNLLHYTILYYTRLY